jgi:Tol biopolymer transport system component
LVRATLTTAVALLSLSTACADSARSVGPPAVERTGSGPATPPAPPAPPISPTPRAGQPPAAEYIYLANADGSAPVRLTLGSWPAWSPDGRLIAFHRSDSELRQAPSIGAGTVHIIGVDGSGETALISGLYPAWSPDGTSIVFTSDEGISVVRLGESAQKTLIRHDFRDDTYKPWDMGVAKPAWSPDGQRIAFEHLGDGDMQPAQAYVMDADGSNPRRVTSSRTGARYAESDPSWSPDGSSLVYWSYWYGIATVDLASGVSSMVYADFPSVAYGAKPVWSPDGRTIAFKHFGPGPLERAIWTARPAGGAVGPFIRGAYEPAWSPDGSRIAFVSTLSERGDSIP